MGDGCSRMTSIGSRGLGTNASIRSTARGASAVGHAGGDWGLMGGLAMHVGDTVLRRRCPLGVRIVTASEVARRSVLTTSRLWDVRLNRHTARDDVSSSSATGSILRGGRATETLGQLLNQGLSHIVNGNVNCISHAKNDEGSLARVRQHGIRSIQLRVRCILDLANAYATLTDDRANEDVGDEKTHWVGLRR
jgi:hypothetical protein